MLRRERRPGPVLRSLESERREEERNCSPMPLVWPAVQSGSVPTSTSHGEIAGRNVCQRFLLDFADRIVQKLF